jgi:hypothetical protein
LFCAINAPTGWRLILPEGILGFCQMVRLIALVIAVTALASCTGTVFDYMPEWAGGLPKSAPPRPGTPEYDAFRRKLEAEAVRDKSKDAGAPKADPGIPGSPK